MATTPIEVSFKNGEYEVMRMIHSQQTVSVKALSFVDSLVVDVLSRVSHQARRLASDANKHTVTINEVQQAVHLVFPERLAIFANSQAQNTMDTFLKHSYEYAQTLAEDDDAEGSPSPSLKHKKPTTKAVLAGIQFNVGTCYQLLKQQQKHSPESSTTPNNHLKVSRGAPVYLAAVGEYVTAELSELSGCCAFDQKRMKLLWSDVVLAIRNDEELLKLVGDKLLQLESSFKPSPQPHGDQPVEEDDPEVPDRPINSAALEEEGVTQDIDADSDPLSP